MLDELFGGQFSDAEMDVFGEFTEALQAGKNPDMEEYLKRCPGSEARMRPILETAVILDREVTRLRRTHQHVDPDKLSELKRQPGPESP